MLNLDKTVKEVIDASSTTKIWLCPHVVHKPSFSTNNLLRGIECSKSSVPKELLGMQVRKYYKEGGFLCIIWYNDPQMEDSMKQVKLDESLSGKEDQSVE